VIALQPLTLYDLLSFIISTAGFVTLIISILLLNYTLKGNVYQASASQMFSIDQLFITYPDMRPYFYSGKDIKEDDPNHDRVLATAEFLQDSFGSILVQSHRFPQIWPAEWWIPYFKDVFANSPVLCRYLESTSNWYHDELINLMKEGKALRQEKDTQQTMLEEKGPL
jgi:hypothetical protein